ncbi:AAA domain-containing protein [Obelidium mucronatum]|nr:AAA domain-containing protein [Obelidium mucronatum]
MTEPLALLPILRLRPTHCLLIGDPQQLSPTLETNTNNPQCSLDRTLYSRLLQHKEKHTSILLRTQYRCHPRIAQIPNRLFYAGELVHGSTEANTGPIEEGLSSAMFVDVSSGSERRGTGGGGSLVNLEEVGCVEELVKALVQEMDNEDGDRSRVQPGNIGVITYCKLLFFFFVRQILNWYMLDKSQAALLQQKFTTNPSLVGVQVSTVDSFQGGEKDVIFISTVRSAEVGFIDDYKRVNVSLTRARRHLIIVGNGRLLNQSHLWREVLNGCGWCIISPAFFLVVCLIWCF